VAVRVTIGEFLDSLSWLDRRPLVVEPYRRRLFERFDERAYDDALAVEVPRYNLGLDGRAKKNWKTTDSMLRALHALFDESHQGSQVFIVANDEDQAGDDLDLLKKLLKVNPRLDGLVKVLRNRIERRDGGGFIEVLPAKDAAGAHGKTYRLLVCDEIHAWRDWNLLEALAPDPTRLDAQQWITSYASMYHRPGAPLFDLLAMAKAGTDPRLLFSWYAADFTTDPDFAELPAEQRANPSMGSWNNPGYLAQQQRRLPSHKYRRLHLNLSGSPEGAPYDAERVMEAVARGIGNRPPVEAVPRVAFVDMSGGSSDDAVLAIAHKDADQRAVLDLVMNQGPKPPFDPRAAVDRFVEALRSYGVRRVTGDAYAGETFRRDFERLGIQYTVSKEPKSWYYEEAEPLFNGHRLVLLDVPVLEQQTLGLVWRGGRIDHPNGEHDDWPNAALGACVLALKPSKGVAVAFSHCEAVL
jgi:hypothetical protein